MELPIKLVEKEEGFEVRDAKEALLVPDVSLEAGGLIVRAVNAYRALIEAADEKASPLLAYLGEA